MKTSVKMALCGLTAVTALGGCASESPREGTGLAGADPTELALGESSCTSGTPDARRVMVRDDSFETAGAMSPDENYGSPSCPGQFVVEFTELSGTFGYSAVNSASLSDIVVHNADGTPNLLAQFACAISHTEVGVYGDADGVDAGFLEWELLSVAKYHGVIPTFVPGVSSSRRCSAVPDAGFAFNPDTPPRYRSVRVTSKRYMQWTTVQRQRTAAVLHAFVP